MLTVRITITLKAEVLDPQGKTIRQSLERLGFDTIDSVRIGKHIEIKLNETDKSRAATEAAHMCEKLLANPVIEAYSVEIID